MVKRRRGLLRRWLLAAPKLLFRARLGFVFRRHIICVEHEGRATGNRHRTALEVLYRDKTSDEYYVISARGERADWYRNIRKYPAEAAYIGYRKRLVRQRFVPGDEAERVFRIYAQRHPNAAEALLKLAADPNDAAWAAALERLPMVAFQAK